MKALSTLPQIYELNLKGNRIEHEFENAMKDPQKAKKIGSFIKTPQAISRLYELESNLLAKNYILLEGPTGSSKTKTVQIYCIIKNLTLVQLNMSGETTEEDLKGRTLSDPNSFSGLKFKKGLFADAFINGKILLIDEINLLNPSVLNFIANALDSKMLILDQEEGSFSYAMHDKFRLIATQNPNNTSFICKREELPEKLLQLFNIVYFPSLTQEEIKKISIEIATQNGYKEENEKKIIYEIAKFHYEWINSDYSKNSPQCFTIRDINNVIKSISNKKDPDFIIDAIICFYGMRYEQKYRNILYNKLIKNKIFPQNELNFQENEYLNFFRSESLQKADKYAKIAIKNGRHILFTGKEGVGITSIAKLIADNNSNNKDKDFTFVFTEETTIGDLIGRFIPDSSGNSNNLIKWENGPLTDAITYGYSGIFLNIDLVDSKILERINCLLDPKETDVDNFFEIPENPSLEKIPIENNFRFYCTCSEGKLDSLSDAFLNRLTIINIDDQLEKINENEFDLCLLINKLLEQEKIDINSDIISHNKLVTSLSNTFFNLKNNNIILSMAKFSRLVKCCGHISKEFPGIDPDNNINYILSLLDNKTNINIPSEILEKLEIKFKNYNKFCNKYKYINENFYIDSQNIKELLINMYICMICKINVCLIGKTGIGKTHLARTFSKIFRENDKSDILFSFNSESTMENLYGTFAFEGGKTTIVEGPLYKAIKEGLVFIADEFNLAEESVIQSLINVLEVSSQSPEVLIPGINRKIPYHKDCFIIICQNDSKTLGRKLLPNLIKKKIKIFEYPHPTFNDIYHLSENIIEKEIGDNSETNKTLAYKLSKLMISLNEKEIPEVGSWSMRDIRKIFRRINNQNKNPKEYKCIKEIHQILIYILGGVPKNKDKILNIFEDIIKLMKEPFNLENDEIDDLRLIIESKAEKKDIILDGKNNIFIMKGKLGKKWFLDDGSDLPKNEFHSFYESLFFANFSDFKEPLLICGPSGYKTFLAKKININSKVIDLYPETSISQLLGSTHIRDNFNAKKYYLKQILTICEYSKDENNKLDIKDIEKLFELYIENNKQKTDKKKIDVNFEDLINKIINGNKKEIVKEVLQQLKKNLFDTTHLKEGQKNRFGNFTSFFQLGLIPQYIFLQKLIILKDVDKILPNVLERFNDLLNYNPKFFLSEDLFNTFTDKNQKEIKNIQNFRLTGISSLDNINNFSEATRNRFTLISTSEYTRDEKTLLIEKISKDCPVNFHKFIEKFEENIEKFEGKNAELSFKIIIKILNLFNELTKKEPYEKERNLILSIYFAFLPFLKENEIEILINILMEVFNKQKSNFNLIQNKFNNFDFKPIFNEINENDNERIIPFFTKDKNIYSKSTGLSIKKQPSDQDEYEAQIDIYFHESFNNLLDILHLSIAIHYPLIIEGETGSGKNKAIEYLSNKLNYKLIKYQITESTTIDELFGKENIKPNGKELFTLEETEFYKTVCESKDNIYNENNTIIVLENIEEASQSIIEALIPLFDKSNPEILLPFGQKGSKKEFNLILTYDPSKHNSSFQNYFPPQIINNSLIYKLYISSENEYENILDILRGNNINNENIITNFIAAKNYIINIQENKIYSLNDLNKFKALFDNQILDDSNSEYFNIIIEKLIFVLSLMNKKHIQNLENKLGYNNCKFDISLEIDENFTSYNLKLKFKEEIINEIKIEYEYPENEKINEDLKKLIDANFKELTGHQKLGIMFLLLSFRSNFISVVQGPECSGKTHLIKTFAQLCNKKIEILDLSNESNLSLFTGQLIPSSGINKNKINNLKKNIKVIINKFPNIKSSIFDSIGFKVDSEKEWTPKQFDFIISELEKENLKLKNETIKSTLNLMKEERNLTKHLIDKESILISAIKTGKWVLLNGIELAQPELFQKLISLCNNENPSLYLFEKGNDYKYEKGENENLKNIHEDFRLFITYNPYIVEMNKRLSPSFLNKCLVFTMFPIDSDLNDAAFILSNLIQKNKNFKEVANELATKFISFHSQCKEYSEKNKNNLYGKKSFCMRTLLSLIKYLDIPNMDDGEKIIRAINDCYCNCFQNKETQENIFFKIYSGKPDEKLMAYLREKGEKFFQKYPNFYNDLKNKLDRNSIIGIIETLYSIEYIDVQDLYSVFNHFIANHDNNEFNNFIFQIISIILYSFINNKEISDKDSTKKIGSNNLKEKGLLTLQNQLEMLKTFIENDWINKNELKKWMKYPKSCLPDLHNSKTIQKFIIIYLLYPKILNNKFDFPITKDLLSISRCISEGKVLKENLIPLIKELNFILDDKFTIYAINNDDYSNDTIKNYFIKEGITYDIKFEERIRILKELLIFENESEENNKILDLWNEKFNTLKNQTNKVKGNEENRMIIEEELNKYKILIDNRREISEEKKGFYNSYIEFLRKISSGYNIDMKKFREVQKSFTKLSGILNTKVDLGDNQEYFNFKSDNYLFEQNTSNKYSDNIQIIESLIQYSLVENNLNKIKNNIDKIKSVKELFHILSNEKDINLILNEFFIYILSSDENDFLEKVNEFESQYKSFLLKKNGIKLLNSKDIINYINELSKRNTLDDASVINWANKTDFLKYEVYFKIKMPKFTPKEVINLFVKKKGINDIQYEYGFKTKNIFTNSNENHLKYKEEVGKIINHKFESYNACLNKLIKIYLKIFMKNIILDEDKSIWNIDEINSYIEKENDKQNRDYLNLIKDLLNIIESINNEEKLNFHYEDFFFLKDKKWYLNNNKNSLNYPSLCFFLIKNQNIEENFVKYFSTIKFDEKIDEFPLYFLLLRIFSSQDIIKCDYTNDENNKITKIIKDKLNALIKESLKKNNLPKDINWIGLFTSDFCNKNHNSVMNEVRNYLYNYSIFGQKDETIISDFLTEEIIDFIFSNTINGNIEKLFTNKFEANDAKLDSLIAPYKILERIINEKKIKSGNDFCNKSRNCFNELIKLNKDGIMSTFYEDFMKVIEESLNDKKRNIKNTYIIQINRQKESKIENFNSDATRYVNLFNNLKNIYNDANQFNINSKETAFLYKKFEEYDIFDDEEDINIGIVNLKNITINENDKIKINDDLLNFGKDQIIYYRLDNYEKDPEIYINNEIISKNKIIYDKIRIKQISNDKKEEVKLQLPEKFQKELENIIPIKEPKLIFINPKKNEENFTLNEDPRNDKILESISTLIDEFINFYQNFNPDDNLSYMALIPKSQKLKKMLDKTFNFENAQFDNGDKADDINTKLKQLFEFKKGALSKIDDLINNNQNYENSISKLQMPKEMNKFKLPKISDIKIRPTDIQIDINNYKVDYFISLSNNIKINFYSGKFKKIIGPIIPEFYNGQTYTFEIFSFVDKTLMVEIEKLKENEYFDCFKIDPVINPLKPIKLYFKISNKGVKKPIEEEISFNLKLKLEGDTEENCKIECIFYIQFLPLKVYISSSIGKLFLHNQGIKLNLGCIFEYNAFNLDFNIPNFKNYEIFNSSFYLQSLENNTAIMPTLSFIKDKKSLKIGVGPFEEGKDYLHFLIFMHMNESIKIIVEIEAKIFKYEYILTFMNVFDEYNDLTIQNENYIVYNGKNISSPSIKIDLLDQKKAKISVNKIISNNNYPYNLEINNGFILDLKEIKNLSSYEYMKLKLRINDENLEFKIYNNYSISTYSNYSPNDIKKKISKYKNLINEKRKSEEIKYNYIKDLYKIICFSNLEENKYQGVELYDENDENISHNFKKSDELDSMNLPEIEITYLEKLPKLNEHIGELQSLNDYMLLYQKLSENLNMLPFLIKLNNYPTEKKQELLNFFYGFYQYSKSYSYCIISKSISDFMNLFIKIYIILNYKKIDKKKYKNNNDEVKNKKAFSSNIIQNFQKTVEKDKTDSISSISFNINLLQRTFNSHTNFIFEDKKNNIINPENKRKKIPVPEFSTINYNFDGKIDIKNNKLTIEQLDYLKNDKSGLKTSIKRMLNSKIDEIYPEDLSSRKTNEQIELKNLFKNGEGDCENIIKDLDKHSILLTLKFMKLTKISLKNYNNTNFIIAIDCCRNINIYEKMENLILAISLSKCFFYLEIPFSIMIFSDYKFQYVIKDFNENFSINIIQRLYNCIISSRFFTRIFDVCYYIENIIKFPRKNKIAIIISNGVDYTLKLGSKWKTYLKNIKFCFFFNNSRIPKENERDVKRIWENFENDAGFPIIQFNFEAINSLTFDLYKYEKLLKTIEDEKIEENVVLIPEYFEYFDFYLDQLADEYKDINKYISTENQVFVQINQAEKPKEKITFNSNSIINYYGLQTSENILNCKSFLDEFENNIEKNNLKLIEEIFPPNKPTLYAPSTKGTKLNFSGLLNFLLTEGQDNKIWLEKKERLKKDYRIAIIIDSSRSCFNKYSFYYSFKAIKALLDIIFYSKIPYFDLIIASNERPIVICTGQDSDILNHSSFIWPLIIYHLYEEKTFESNNISCNLYDAIYLAMQIKIQQNSKKFYCFVLTDGIFDENYKHKLKNLCSSCEYSQINIYGIGLGLYPEGLPLIFSKCLWCPDIKLFCQALSSMLKNEKIFPSNINLKLENNEERSNLYKKMKECLEKINKGHMNYCSNIDIYNFLSKRRVYIESMFEVMNKDPFYKDLTFIQKNIKNDSMFNEGFFKNFKILICCFWNKSIASTKERDEVDYRYLTERFDPNKKCLADVLSFYGIEKNDIKVVVDYEKGINEMKTGKYYSTWIICGRGNGVLPEGGNANLVGQFINCTIRYWEKGGSLVWWCDNEPLCFEFNLFMKTAYSKFPGEVQNAFKFGGNNYGATVMVAGDIDKNPVQRFNNQRYFDLGNLGEKEKKYSVPALGHSLDKIAIGTTVSFAQNIENATPLKKKEEVKPFIPFAFDDKGCITILFYISPLNSNTGNIIVDGGFSKLFTELETEGTGKYIQNIIGFTSMYQKHLERDGENWMENFSLKSFEQNIDFNEKYEGFIKKILTKEYDIVYMIDSTGSMANWIGAAHDRCINISEELKEKFPYLDFYFGGIFYRDPIDSKTDKHEVFDLTNDMESLKGNFNLIKADGGGDEEEDWVGAYEKSINSINWKDGTKLIIHIADAPAHTKEYCGRDNHEEEDGKLQTILRICANKDIKIISFAINTGAEKSFKVCEEYYKEYNGFYKIFSFDEAKTSIISDNFKDLVIEAAVCAAPKEDEIV